MLFNPKVYTISIEYKIKVKGAQLEIFASI